MVDLRTLFGVVVGSVVGTALAAQGRCPEPSAHAHCVPGRLPIVHTDEGDRLLCDEAGHWVFTRDGVEDWGQ